MTLTNAQIETICEDCIGTFPGMTTRANMEALRDLALAAKEMEEELAKARYHVLGYKGDYDELCKRYTTCERELGSVMKERDAMREAIKRAEQDLLGIHVKAEHSDKLRSICARLVQSLNPKNEEKS